MEVGYIGTGCYENDESKRDLSFNLENGSAMMDWCYRKQAADTAYTLVFTYAAKSVGSLAANQLHAGCDLNLHGYNLRNAVLSDWSFDGGTISDTISGYYAKSYHDDGRAATWRQFKMVFKNGILTDLLL